MGNMIEGDVYRCDECALELKITKPCDEEECDLICCSKQMKKTGSQNKDNGFNFVWK